MTTRSLHDYFNRGVDTSNVDVARDKKKADTFFKTSENMVPNNPLIADQIQEEIDYHNNMLREYPYRDGRGINLPGTSIDYAMQRPADPAMRMMADQPMGSTEAMGDLRWADQVKGSGGPLAGPPNQTVMDPGIAQVKRYETGQPMGRPLPPGGPPAAVEDLRSAMELMPASQELGDPSDAMLPRAGRGSTPGKGGRPGVMPQRRP